MPRPQLRKRSVPNKGAIARVDTDPTSVDSDENTAVDPLTAMMADSDPVLDDIDFDFESRGPLALRGVKLDEAKWEYRWIRYADGGGHDPANISQAHQEGFRPVPVTEMPAHIRPPTMNDGSQLGSVFAVRDQVFSRRPRAIAEKYRQALKAHTDAKTRSVVGMFNADMAEEVGQGRAVTLKPEMTFKETRGRQPQILDD